MGKWYEDRKKTVFVATYQNEKELNRELQEAVKLGWVIKDTSGLSGHINVGRTMSRAIATGGLGLVFGASRTKGKIVVSYERDPFAVQILEVESRIASLQQDYTKCLKKLAELDTRCTSSWPLPAEDSKCAELAKKLSEALKDRGDARRKTSELELKLADAFDAAYSTYNRAGDSPPERLYSAQELRKKNESESSLSQDDVSAGEKYQEYAKSIKSFLEAQEDVKKKAKSRDDARHKVDEASNVTSRASSEKDQKKAESKLTDARKDLEKAEAALKSAEEAAIAATSKREALQGVLPTVTSN